MDIRFIVNLTAQPLYYRADLGFCSGRVMATGHCWYLYPSYAELENPGNNEYSQKCVVYPITVRQRKLVIIREDPPGSTVTNQLSPEVENNFFHRLGTHQILIQIPTHRDHCSLPSISPASRGFRSSILKPFSKHQASTSTINYRMTVTSITTGFFASAFLEHRCTSPTSSIHQQRRNVCRQYTVVGDGSNLPSQSMGRFREALDSSI